MTPKPDTRQALLDLAGELFLRQGYLGFSYSDLAEKLGLRKASIHYHFASKEELGTAVLRDYQQRFGSWRKRMRKRPVAEQFPALVALFKSFLALGGICPCGMASAEYLLLPAAMQQVLQNFYAEQEQALIDILQAARAEGLLSANLDVEAQALQLGATLQGAIQIARMQEQPEWFEQIMQTAWQNLLPR